jgi:hypothetical protein
VASLIIIQIMKKCPNGMILELLRYYFGKTVEKAGTLLFALYFGILANVIFIREALFIQAWILPRTEIYVTILLLTVPSYLIARKNINILGRYAELVFFMTLWTVLIYLFTLKNAEWLYLLPVLKEGWGPILTTVKTAIFSFGGFEIVFFSFYLFVMSTNAAPMPEYCQPGFFML